MTRLRCTLAVALLVLGLGAVGCGDDSGESGAAATAESREGDSRDKTAIEAENGAFSAQAVFESAGPGVVTVSSIFEGEDGSLLEGAQAGQGSGFVLNDEGEIATNAHVVTDAQAAGSGPINQADEVYVAFSDQNQVEAKVIGFDPFADVALLKVDPDGLDLNPIELGDIESVEIGEPVAAIGSPFGERQSLSTGIVSATDRSIASLTQFQIDGAIQTDASINPGNSGGPLLDADGRVIGLNQQIDTTTGGNQGVGFAVPIDLATRSLDQLREEGEARYAYLGVTTVRLYPQLAEKLGIDAEVGSIVDSIQPDSPAEEAGLQEGSERLRFQGSTYRAGGDVIVAIDGEELTDGADLPVIVNRYAPGETVTLEVVRDGKREELEVTFGERPDQLQQVPGLRPDDG